MVPGVGESQRFLVTYPDDGVVGVVEACWEWVLGGQAVLDIEHDHLESVAQQLADEFFGIESS